nr:hemin uptake protein HemP [Azorhizobium doebereinerae]
MTKHDHAPTAWQPEPRTRAVPVFDEKLDSRDLFVASRVLTITHGSQTYQLRLTSQNKLILTK